MEYQSFYLSQEVIWIKETKKNISYVILFLIKDCFRKEKGSKFMLMYIFYLIC